MQKPNRLIKSSIAFFIICLVVGFFAINYTTSKKEEVYDLILFWGQSNMVGYCGIYKNEHLADSRYNYADMDSIISFSQKTGIDKTILDVSRQICWVAIKPEAETSYEYAYMEDNLKAITEKTQYFGETLKYNIFTKKLEIPKDKTFSIEKSYGTNMIPQFCKTYYKKTGHKVVAVLAANGGQKIANFLPSKDADYGDKAQQFIYEAMVEKYRAALNYMNNKGYKVGNRIWVAFQGEADVGNTSTEEYKRLFLKVHKNLKKDLNITKGAIVQTSYTIGTDLYKQVNRINKAQRLLVAKNEEIITGSTYAYDRYIPDETTYYNENVYYNKMFLNAKGEKLPYAEAFNIASCSVCYPNNSIHFTSATLSQIGKEVADNLVLSSNTK